jgi:nucleotide-binding universal stress UspA family protein
MPERITLVIDGGVASAAALEWTLARAATTDVEVRLTSIDGSDSPQANPQRLLETSQALGQAAALFAKSASRSKVEMVMLRGKAVDRLARESEAADLIVIGSDHIGVVAGVLNANLPLAIVSRSSCPVVIVPAAWTSSTGPVVVGVDEPTSAAAHEFAAREAERLGRDLLLVRAWELPPMVTTELLGSGTVDESIRDANSELLTTAASGIALRHGSLPLREKLSYATPSRALAAAAESMELVVVGTHHRHVLAQWMLGSVGHDLVMHLRWPVAIVPPVERAASSSA